MKKVLLLFFLAVSCLLAPAGAEASEMSSDTMILDYSAQKVWLDKGNLCVRGTFYNKRGDLTVTKLNELTMTITFTGTDGHIFQFTGRPEKYPMLKIPANGSKTVTFNFGPFTGEWKSWTVSEQYIFTYINGARW